MKDYIKSFCRAKNAGRLLQLLLKSESAEEILNGILMKAMEEVGRAFSAGELLIPEVLESYLFR